MPLFTSNLNKHWKTQSIQVKDVLNEFSKQYFDNIFVRNLDVLQYNSTKIKFNKESWKFNTLQFCDDEYGEQYLYPIVHIANNIGSLFEFYSEKLNGKILKPSIDIISELLHYKNTGGIRMSTSKRGMINV